ncbi:MAG: endonuclease/exonuclease/phosphatase family protein [Phycisphaerae bacterium]
MNRRPFRTGVAIVCVCALMIGAGCGRGPRLRVATWNVAHGRGLAFNQIGLPRETFEANLRAMAGVLRRERPDVVCLQEADGASDWSGGFDHVAFLAEAAGYPFRHHGLHVETERLGVRLRYGTALLSRLPLREMGLHPFDAEIFDTKGAAWADVVFGGRTVTVISVHLDFKRASVRCRQVDALVERFQSHDEPLIIAGDFNCSWGDGEDALRRIAERLSLRCSGNDGGYTFPSHAPEKRLDWILISEDLEFVDSRIWPDLCSDHLGVVATLAWR